MTDNRSIARLQIPVMTLPSTPSAIQRQPRLQQPNGWAQNPVMRRPSTDSNSVPNSPSSSLSSPSWGQQHFLPPATNTSLLTATQGYAAQSFPRPPESAYGKIGFPNSHPPRATKRMESSDSGLGCSSSADSKDYRGYGGSILKKQGNMNGYSSAGGTLRRSLQRDGRRKVVFKNSVSVYWYDSDAESVCSPTNDRRLFSDEATYGQGSPPVISELCGEPGSRGGVQHRGSYRKRMELSCTGNAVNFRDATPRGPTSGSSFLAQRRPSHLPRLDLDSKRTSVSSTPRCDTSAHGPQVAIVQDQVTFQRKLIITIQLSLELHPYDVLVKANKNGNKIRVVISKDASLRMHGSGVNEHISLPVDVDPYQLSARLDRDGVLHIEAPAMS